MVECEGIEILGYWNMRVFEISDVRLLGYQNSSLGYQNSRTTRMWNVREDVVILGSPKL